MSLMTVIDTAQGGQVYQRVAAALMVEKQAGHVLVARSLMSPKTSAPPNHCHLACSAFSLAENLQGGTSNFGHADSTSLASLVACARFSPRTQGGTPR